MVQFKQNYDKELKTTTEIVKDGVSIKLTEKELLQLIEQICKLRDDSLSNVLNVENIDKIYKLENLEADLDFANSEISRLESKIEDLEYELDERED